MIEQTSEMQKKAMHKLSLCEQGMCEQGACGKGFCYAGGWMWYCVAWSSHGLMSWSVMSLKIPAAIRPGPPDRPCCRVMSIVFSVSGNIGGEISPINKSVSSLLSCTLLGPVTRFRLTSESRYVNGHWVVSGPLYIGLGQFWIFDFPKKKMEENRKNRKNRKKMVGLPAVSTAGSPPETVSYSYT